MPVLYHAQFHHHLNTADIISIMKKPFYNRLAAYYRDISAKLQAQSSAGGIFANSGDVGTTREHTLGEFLRQHLPSKLNVLYGGFLFHIESGDESKQLDIIISTDTQPQFSATDGEGKKSFAPVEGTLGVVSSKSNLDKPKLEEALAEFASIPPSEPLTGRLAPVLQYDDKRYRDWPYKILISRRSPSPETVLKNINAYYQDNPDIPIERRPNVIYVPGSYSIVKAIPGVASVHIGTGQWVTPEPGSYEIFQRDPDPAALANIVLELQQIATVSTHILFQYNQMLNKISHTVLVEAIASQPQNHTQPNTQEQTSD